MAQTRCPYLNQHLMIARWIQFQLFNRQRSVFVERLWRTYRFQYSGTDFHNDDPVGVFVRNVRKVLSFSDLGKF
jgi:hypothetical protein|tara:strand:+ start:277 stop:498 length:222 start_codon:yes stop_codon:yes gene_type:complete